MNRIMKNQRAARIANRQFNDNGWRMLKFYWRGSPLLRFMQRRNDQADTMRAGGAQ